MKFWLRLLGFNLLALGVLIGQQAKSAANFEISGTVVDAGSGQPLADAHIGVAPVTQRDNFRVVVTGEDGRFFFNGLAKGKYALTAQRRGYLTESFDQHQQYSTSISVGPDLDAHNLVFRMHPQASISGRIMDEHNEPVRNAEVMLFQENAPGQTTAEALRGRTRSDDEGYFHFGHLPPGKYQVAADAEVWYAQRPGENQGRGRMGLRTSGDASQAEPNSIPPPEPASPLDVAYPITYFPGATDPASAGSITLVAGDKFTADITLQPVPSIHTRITLGDPDSHQHFNADLRQRIPGGSLTSVHATVTEVSPGVVEISGVPPGHYSMSLNSWDEKGSGSPQKAEVDLGAGEAASLQMPVNATVSGVIKFDSGEQPPSRGSVSLRDRRTGENHFGQISDKGEFEFREAVPAGAYEVSVNALSQSLVKQITAEGAKVNGEILEIKGGAPVKLAISLTRGLGRVDGVALRDDKPAAGIMIVLTPEDPVHNPLLFRRDQSDSDGTFTLPVVMPGRYTVLAIADGWELDYKSPEVLKRYLPQGTPVQVDAKGKYEIKVKVQ